MNCEEYRNAVHDYALGTLSAERAAQVELHRRECPDCVEFNALCAEVSCRDFVKFLGEYIDEALPSERRRVFDRHMTICPECTAYLDSYRRTIALGAAAGRAEERENPRMPDELLKAILDAYREDRD